MALPRIYVESEGRGVGTKMVSTWREDKNSLSHCIMSRMYPERRGPTPVFKRTKPSPVLTQWSLNSFVIISAAWPMVLQIVLITLTGSDLSPKVALVLYTFAWYTNAAHEARQLRALGTKIGFLDGDQHERDDIPNDGVSRTLLSVIFPLTIRPLYTVLLTYNRAMLPIPTKWLLVELVGYSIILDLLFYIYHRACHEMSSLWSFHRTHHLSKHPNPLLTAYADLEQELIEQVLIPLGTYAALRSLGLPMTFYDWWICHQFIIFTELWLHSGLRAYGMAPGPASFVLAPFDCELTIEDHDLHHRHGWRNAHTYGKQTRLWDACFGTQGKRVEVEKGNIDWRDQISFPFF